MKDELYCDCEKKEEILKGEFNLMEQENEGENVNNFDELKWANHLFESMYYLWFAVFIVKLKQNFYTEYYVKFIDYAIFLITSLRKKNHHVSEIMYRCIIESCGYYGKDDKVIQLV